MVSVIVSDEFVELGNEDFILANTDWVFKVDINIGL